MLNLDEEWQKALNSEVTTAVIAGPGGRKSTLAIERGLRAARLGMTVLFLVFSRNAAEVLRQRLKQEILIDQGEAIIKFPQIAVSTIHSLCYQNVGWKLGYDSMLWTYHKYVKDKQHFDLVVADEFQDLNSVEFKIVWEVGDIIFAVGDPFQSIYGYQGALGIDAFFHLLKAPNSTLVELHGNYRSCPKIIDKLESIFKRDLQSCGIRETGLTRILCRTREDILYLSKYLEKTAKIPHLRIISQEDAAREEKPILGPSDLSISTYHASKGSEFDRVISYDWYPLVDIETDPEEHRVYYVGVARASKEHYDAREPSEVVDILGG